MDGLRNGDACTAARSSGELVAIVGMGCRWSGDVSDSHKLWELLNNRRSSYKDFGDHRFGLEGFYSRKENRPGTFSTKGAHLLNEDPRLFDYGFFSIPAAEVETMDPSQRKLLEVVYEAFENAGVPWESFSGSQTGVFVGNFSTDHAVIQGRDEYVRPYTSTGTAFAILSNRVSYTFNLKGPSVTLDTACSSGMYALHMAVAAIRNGDCDSAIVSGCNCILDPNIHISLQNLGVLSSTSCCHTFDASADGYCRGEGYAALYITKLSIAVTEKLPIRAVIRGTAINANGKTGGLSRPSETGQEAVIRKAYENAGDLLTEDTTYIESHGTGTSVGDPIEINGLGAALKPERQKSPLLIGSNKPNLGHTEAASAIASIMKVVLALENGIIPPTIGVTNLNPDIDLRGGAIKIVTEPTPWPHGRLRRAGINNFGFGGANSHCILDHVENVLPGYIKPGVFKGNDVGLRGLSNGYHKTNGHGSDRSYNHSEQEKHAVVRNIDDRGASQESNATVPLLQKADSNTRQYLILPFSAHHDTSLRLNIEASQSDVNKCSVADLAFTLSNRRTKFPRRTFRIADKDDLIAGLKSEELVSVANTDAQNVAFIFTGQGAQWNGMGRHLFQYHVFKRTILHMNDILQQLPNPPSWTLQAVLDHEYREHDINIPIITQTVCTAVQIGLVDLLASWNVMPAAVAGHSSGEIAAAYAAGRITAAEAIIAAYLRGCAISTNQKQGTMLAVGLGREEVADHVEGFDGRVTIAAVNSPQSVTLSGDSEPIAQISQALDDLGIFNRKLRTGDNAYHSHHMLSIGQAYEDQLARALEELPRKDASRFNLRPAVSWVSSVFPFKDTTNLPIDASYWRANLESPVQFSAAVSKLLKTTDIPLGVLVEIGPHAALKGPLQQIMNGVSRKLPYVSCLIRGQNDQLALLRMAGTLFSVNDRIDMARVNATDCLDSEGNLSYAVGCTATQLAPYRYTYGPILYSESSLSKGFRGRTVQRHDLLGSKVPGTSKLTPQWRNILRVKDLPWLSDHKLIPHVVFPASAFMTTAMAAVEQWYHERPNPIAIAGISLRNVDFITAMRVPEDDIGVEMVTSVEPGELRSEESPSWIKFSIASLDRETAAWTVHCTGSARIETNDEAGHALVKLSKEMDARHADKAAWYRRFKEIGFNYGPSFQGVSDIRADPTESLAVAKLNLRTTTEEYQSTYPIHPASLDALQQMSAFAWNGGQPAKATCAFVPVHVDRAFYKFGNKEDWGVAIAKGERVGLRGAYGRLQLHNQSGEVVVDIDRLRCVSHFEIKAEREYRAPYSNPFWRLAWRPDIRTLEAAQARDYLAAAQAVQGYEGVLNALDRLASLILADISSNMTNGVDLSKTTESAKQYIHWVKTQPTETSDLMTEAKSLNGTQRAEAMKKLVDEYGQSHEIMAAHTLFQHMNDILSGQIAGIDVLSENGLADIGQSDVFVASLYPQLTRYFDSLGFADPSLTLLEVGGGRGNATKVILDSLSSKNMVKRYRNFTFTDVSEDAVNRAKDALSSYAALKFAVLDIEKDVLEQQFTQKYDVVFVSQRFYTAKRMSLALENCRRLLKPGGKLLLLQNIEQTIGQQFILGALPDYWAGDKEDSCLNLGTWEKSLTKAGFSDVDVLLHDLATPQSGAVVMVATAKHSVVESYLDGHEKSNSDINILYGSEKPALVDRVTEELGRRQISHSTTQLAAVTTDMFETGCRLLVFLEPKDAVIDINESILKSIREAVTAASTVLWITASGILKAKRPDGALITGLLRTLGTEIPTSRFRSIDYDPEERLEDGALVKVILDQESQLQVPIDEENEDRDFAWQDGRLWISRLVPDVALHENAVLADMPSDLAVSLPFHGQEPIRADFEVPGVLSSLFFKPFEEATQELPKDWIQVKVLASGLNWKDIASCSGRIDQNALSGEYCGAVEQVGSDVRNVAVGDNVYAFGKGYLGNVVRAPAIWAQRLKPEDDLVQVASMPLVYMTVLYAFEHITRLKQGDKVLIQSATGGLGLAALRFAKSMGAEVFATVGTAEKRNYLVEVMGMDESRIFSSRGPVKVAEMIRASGGKGFDIILGTSQADTMQESIRALAPLGRYIDVGRVDVQNSKTLELELFKKSVSFCSFDLGVVLDAVPAMGQTLMESLEAHYRAGRIGPIPQITTYDISELATALLQFSKGKHIGKIVMTYQDPASHVKMIPSPLRAKFSREKVAIIVGGFGGLGRSIIRWMAGRGCRHLLVLTRSGAQSPEASSLISDLASQGISVESVSCDVSNVADVSRIVAEASSVRPIQGIVHAAVSYQDLSFHKLTADQWNLGLQAKVQGTKNLHEATKCLNLDFFVLVTSTEPYLGLATQSAYTAANNFQELFARYRRSQGLVASTVAFGFVSDLGHLSTNIVTANMGFRNKLQTLTEYQFLRLLEPAFFRQAGSQGIAEWSGQADDPLSITGYVTSFDPAVLAADEATRTDAKGLRPRWYSDARVSLVMRSMEDAILYDPSREGRDDAGDESSATRIRRQFQDSLQSNDGSVAAEDLAAAAIASTVAQMVFIDAAQVSPSRSVSDYGVDSLIAAELRHWFSLAFGSDISMLELLDTKRSIKSIAKTLVEKRYGELHKDH
ncbi:hypothetical protein V2G26_010208 [Clonostachys chloroleuca]